MDIIPMTGHWKSLKTEIFFSIKDRIIFLWTKNYDKIFYELSMITKLLDTLENCKLIMWYDNTIGGQDFELL